MSRPSILFAAYQTDRGANGGMESATRIFEALAGDFRWTLLTNIETDRTRRWREGGARIIPFGFRDAAGKLARSVDLGLASCRVLAQRADILHANDIRAAQLLLPAATLRRRPFAFTVRDTKEEDDDYGTHWLRVARRLDMLVTLSGDMARRLGARLPLGKVQQTTIGSILDLATFRPADAPDALRAKLGIAKGEIALGLVAGFNDKKRQLDVIRDLMPRLRDLPVRLHLVGDYHPETESYSRDCRLAAEETGLAGRIIFHGFRRDVADWLAALDIVLVASRREGLARCMIEAMACGTPVVSFDVASAREMLEETGAGVVVRGGDWEGLAGAIRTLAGDPALRQAMGQAGRRAAEDRFDATRIAEKWRSLYLSLASRDRGTAA